MRRASRQHDGFGSRIGKIRVRGGASGSGINPGLGRGQIKRAPAWRFRARDERLWTAPFIRHSARGPFGIRLADADAALPRSSSGQKIGFHPISKRGPAGSRLLWRQQRAVCRQAGQSFFSDWWKQVADSRFHQFREARSACAPCDALANSFVYEELEHPAVTV